MVVVFSGDADFFKLFSKVFLWKKEDMLKEELNWFLEWIEGVLEESEQLLSLVSD